MKKHNKPRLNESSDAADLVKMQTEVALVESMAQSKALTIMLIVGLSGFAGFFLLSV